MVFWLPASRDQEFQYWERIGTVPRAEIKVEHGVCTTPATSVRARQRLGGGLLGRLARKLTGTGGDESWTLPDGQPAEKCGERKTGSPAGLARERINGSRRGVGPNPLAGIDAVPAHRQPTVPGLPVQHPPPAKSQTPPGPAGTSGTEELGCPVALAEQLLEAARQSGDRSKEAAALIDLGIVTMNEGDLKKAVAHLEKAVELGRQLGNKAREIDALHNLGYALLAAGSSGSGAASARGGSATGSPGRRPVCREAHRGTAGRGPCEHARPGRGPARS